MALNLGVLTFQVQANTAGFNKSMAAIGSSAAKTTEGLTKLTAAATAMGAAVLAAGAAAVSIAAGFEQGLARVQAVSGATEEQLQSMKTSALEVAAATKFTARESADAMGLLAQAGFNAEQIMSALPGTMELAAAGMVSVQDAAGIASATLRGMGLEVSELGRVNDILVKSSASSNVNVLQLGESLKLVAPVAASAGISLEETVAAIGLLGDAGIQASTAGTTLRGAIARLLSPSNQVTEALDRLGVEVLNAQGDLIPFADVIEKLGESGAKTGDLMTIFGLKAGPGVAALVSRGADALRDMEDSLRNAGGTAESIAKKQMDTLTGRVLILGSKLEGLAISFGDIMVPAVKLAADVLGSALDVMQDMSPAMKTAALVVAGAAASFSLLVAGAGALLIGVPLVSAAFASLGGIMTLVLAKSAALVVGLTAKTVTLGLAINAALGGIPALTALIVTAIGAVIAAIVVAIKRLSDLIDAQKEARETAFGTEEQQAGFQSRLAAANAPVAAVDTTTTTNLLAKFTARVGEAAKKSSELRDAFQELKRDTESAFKDVEFEEISIAEFDELVPSLEAMDDALGDSTRRASDFGGMLDGIDLVSFSKDVNNASKRLGDIDISAGEVSIRVENAVMSIAEEFEAIADQSEIAARASEFAAEVDKNFDAMAAEFDAVAEGVSSNIAEVATGVGEALKSAGSSIVSALGQAGELVGAAIEGAAQGGIWGAIIAVIAELLTQVDEFTSITDRLNEFLKPLLEGFNDLLKGIKPLIDLDLGFIGTVFAFIGAIFKTLGTALGFVVNFLIEAASGFVAFAKAVGADVGTAMEDLQRAKVDVSVDDFTDTWDQFGADVSKVWESGQKTAQDKITKIVDEFGNAVPAGLADSLRGDQEGQREFGFGVSTATAGLDEFSRGLGEATRKLLNVPSGFDIVSAVRAASDFGTNVLGAGAGPGAGGGVAGGNVFTGNTFVIQANDPDELLDRLAERAEDREFSQTGAGVDTSEEFAIPETTGQNV